MAERRLAVLGKPIGHSRSPQLHHAAYRALGLPWSYERIEMTGGDLPAFLDGLGAEWRGLSLTMPVKHDVIPLLHERHELVEFTGVCNTLLLHDGVRRGFNTDVYGIVAAFREAGVERVAHVQVLGGGATAASAVAASSILGAKRVTLSVRSPQRALPLLELAPRLGVSIEIEQLGDRVGGAPDAVVSTLPNGAHVGELSGLVRPDAVLLDVAYEPWPSPLAALWEAEGGTVISGVEMLLHQAVMQVRIFVGGGPDSPLPDEDAVTSAMRDAAAAPSL